MKALITGASGFIGAHLAQALAAGGHQIRGLVRANSDTARLEPYGVERAIGDIRDFPSVERAVRGVDAVFHLAGLVKGLSLDELLRTNEQGALHVAQACAAQATPPVLVLVSSLAAAGPSFDGRPRVESDPAQPISNYGRSKRAGEIAAAAFADRIPLSIVRPPVVFGEGDPAMAPAIRPIKQLRLHLLPGLSLRRASMLHAADLVPGLIAAALRGERIDVADPDSGRGIYYFASERDPSLGEWGTLIAQALGQRVLVLHLPAAVGWGIAGATEVVSQLRRRANIFSLDKMRELTAGSWVCAADRARRELDFSVAEPLETRVAQMVEWYVREGWV